MNFSAQIGAALFGAIGVITLSLFTIKIAKYFIGIGIFGVFFILTFALTGDIDTSTFIGMSIAVLLASIFDWVLKTDLYSTMLLIALATMGFILLAILLSNLWQFYQFNFSSYSDNQLFQFHKTIIDDYRQMLNELRR